MGSVQRSPHAALSASTMDRPSVHCCERSSPVKNRMREICTSGTVRGGDGNILTYSASNRQSASSSHISLATTSPNARSMTLVNRLDRVKPSPTVRNLNHVTYYSTYRCSEDL
jgi:hypothetical protein